MALFNIHFMRTGSFTIGGLSNCAKSKREISLLCTKALHSEYYRVENLLLSQSMYIDYYGSSESRKHV